MLLFGEKHHQGKKMHTLKKHTHMQSQWTNNVQENASTKHVHIETLFYCYTDNVLPTAATVCFNRWFTKPLFTPEENVCSRQRGKHECVNRFSCHPPEETPLKAHGKIAFALYKKLERSSRRNRAPGALLKIRDKQICRRWNLCNNLGFFFNDVMC